MDGERIPVPGINTPEPIDENWRDEGLCKMYHPSTFFPTDGVGVDKARKICAGCPVKEVCLEEALEKRIEHGVWGGASERERRRILKQRREAAQAVIDVA